MQRASNVREEQVHHIDVTVAQKIRSPLVYAHNHQAGVSPRPTRPATRWSERIPVWFFSSLCIWLEFYKVWFQSFAMPACVVVTIHWHCSWYRFLRLIDISLRDISLLLLFQFFFFFLFSADVLLEYFNWYLMVLFSPLFYMLVTRFCCWMVHFFTVEFH